jgi:opacity protein-like surface antigen
LQMKKILFKLCLPCILFFSPSITLALDPMGPPVAELEKNQFSIGAEYSASRMDLKLNEGKITRKGYINGTLSSISSGPLNRYIVTNMHMDKVWAKISYGVTGDWDVFLRLGTADMDFDYSKRMNCVNNACQVFPSGQKFNGHNNFAIGLGTKLTFHKEENLKWGGLFQISWCQSDGKDTGSLLAASSITGYGTSYSHSIDVDLVEIHVALGPDYRLTDNISVYGGPFLHFINGDIKGHYYESGTSPAGTLVGYSSDYSYDIDQRAFFGGYVGLEMNVTKNISSNIEYQHTAAADALALNLTWKF